MISIRLALPVERRDLKQLQWRASLNNPGDRVALLANPDAIALPLEQIESGALGALTIVLAGLVPLVVLHHAIASGRAGS